MEQLVVVTSISAPHSLALPSKVEHIHDPITPLSVYYRETFAGTPGDMHKKSYNSKIGQETTQKSINSEMDNFFCIQSMVCSSSIAMSVWI